MKVLVNFLVTVCLSLACLNTAIAGVISSDQVIAQQQKLYNQQQLIDLVDSQAVQDRLVSLGVNIDDAKARIGQMTDAELNQFHNQLSDLPAGQGIGGTIITVLVVIAVLDLLGVTDVYPFIRPIN